MKEVDREGDRKQEKVRQQGSLPQPGSPSTGTGTEEDRSFIGRFYLDKMLRIGKPTEMKSILGVAWGKY